MSGGVGSGGHGWRVMSPGEACCMYCGRCCWVFKWFPLNAGTSFYMPLFTSRNFWPFVRAQQQEKQKQQQQSTRFDNRSISLNNQAMSHAAATAAKKNATLDQKVEASSKFLSPEAKRGWKINTPTLIHTHTQTHTVTMTGTTAAIKENTFTNLFACTLSFSVVPTLFLSLTLAPSAYNVTKAPE